MLKAYIFIFQVCEEEGSKRGKVAKKAKEIVDEIAHTFSLRTIRFMAFMLSKIVKRLFRHVYVNRSGIEKVSRNLSYCICYPFLYSSIAR